MSAIMEQFLNYLNNLDWAYIITFILISYGITHYKVTEFLADRFSMKIRKRYRVLLVGVVYGIIIFFIRGYDLSKVECIFQSFVFAIVFHKLLIAYIIEKIFKTPKDSFYEIN